MQNKTGIKTVLFMKLHRHRYLNVSKSSILGGSRRDWLGPTLQTLQHSLILETWLQN